jgi:hypothetical protein
MFALPQIDASFGNNFYIAFQRYSWRPELIRGFFNFVNMMNFSILFQIDSFERRRKVEIGMQHKREFSML